ncbi:MAG TPA: T9SS type A sorting domain-containing protein, partial [Bacteroidia bacterium]|nr:T9SS type A sorting domain-containing protein [Bacteroidia bacterium]HNU32974.1 T9SS type A sorting domain-containing protein [Bacteroidia bacterium]
FNICLYGPTTTLNDHRFTYVWRDGCNPNDATNILPTHEGMSGGIMVLGNECEVAYCEIYGFRAAGCMVRDMVKSNPGNDVSPQECWDPDVAGNFYFHHNYVHNCIANGNAYGLYVGSGRHEKYYPDPTNLNFFNFYRPDEIAHIHNNIFSENKHDIDNSSGRISMFIYNNTFSQRSVRENIHMHNNDSYVYNPMYNNANPGCTEPYTFWDVGGTQTHIYFNAFYRTQNNIDFVYPDINPVNQTYLYTYLYPVLRIDNNYFSTYEHLTEYLGHDDLDWFAHNCSGREGHNKITSANRQHYTYKFYGPFPQGDDYIQIGENTTADPPNKCQAIPFDALSETPIAVITSATDEDIANGTPTSLNAKIITQNQALWFDTRLCSDKYRNQPPDAGRSMVNIWNFGRTANILDDEIRRDNTNVNLPFPINFSEIGITNVTLTTLDLSPADVNDWRASDIAKQLITVTPTDAENVYLSFWIKDSYTGREVQSYGTTGHGVDYINNSNNPPPPAQLPTGFRKFARVSTDGGATWHYLYDEDIVGDDGWQHIVVLLLDANGNRIEEGIIEIGLRTAGTQVDAERVKGVLVYIDDVYINSTDFYNVNALMNGDFENRNAYFNDPTQPVSSQPENWEVTNWPIGTGNHPFVAPNGCTPGFAFSYSDQGISLSTNDVRSGFYSMEGWVKPTNIGTKRELQGNTNYASFQNAVFYQANHVYKSVQQAFNVHAHTSRLSKKTSFSVKPNPSVPNEQLLLLSTDVVKGTSYFELYNPQGNLILKDDFAGNQYKFNSPIAPGIYLAKLINNNNMSYQKVVVTH